MVLDTELDTEIATITKRPRRPFDGVAVMAIAVVTVPILIVVVRIAALGHVHLTEDLALIDLRVRDALHFHQLLGPFDRFGWKHPGPAYFYLLSFVHRFVGDGGRSEFIGAALINLSCALGTVWVVRRHAGRWAALLTSGCLGAFALMLTYGSGLTSPLGVLLSPWNPNVVVFPLILFGVLCAVGAIGSWAALAGAALVGTFAVQTDIGTLPVVAMLLVGSGITAVVRARRASTGISWRVLALGGGATFLLWLPPIIQQVGNSPGNLTLIWRFFTATHPHHGLGSSLNVVLAADENLMGFPHRTQSLPQLSDLHVVAILTTLVIVGFVGVVLGLRRGRPIAVALALASLVGLVVSVFAATRIVGPVYPYLLQWEVALPILAVLGLGVAVVGVEPRLITKTALYGAATLVLVAFSAAMVRLPVAHASNRKVAEAWQIIEPHIAHDRNDTIQVESGAWPTLFGLIDELTVHGFRACTSANWHTSVGSQYVCTRVAPVLVLLYTPQSPQVERPPGFVGRMSGMDIQIVRSQHGER